jgi:cell division protein FtsB
MMFSIFTAFKVKHDNIIMVKKTYNEKYAEVQCLKEQIRSLEMRIEELNSPEGIEKEARKRLNMVREGEKIIRPVYK